MTIAALSARRPGYPHGVNGIEHFEPKGIKSRFGQQVGGTPVPEQLGWRVLEQDRLPNRLVSGQKGQLHRVGLERETPDGGLPVRREFRLGLGRSGPRKPPCGIVRLFCHERVLDPAPPPRAGPGWAGADGTGNARHEPQGSWQDIGGKDGMTVSAWFILGCNNIVSIFKAFTKHYSVENSVL
jgi:hypothetical protein